MNRSGATALGLSALCIALALVGCNRQAATNSAPNGDAAANQPASNVAPVNLPDRVAAPQVVESERDQPAPHLLTVAPNVTEICCALGLRDSLVGRSRYCTYPPGIEDVPDIGALIDINVEVLVGLRPDLVLVSGTSRAQVERLDSLGLHYESVPDATLDDLFAAIGKIGSLTNRPQTAAALAAGIRADLDTVDQRFANSPPQRVLLLIGTLTDPPQPPYVAGPGSFYDELLRRAGHTNIAPPQQGAFVPLSLEVIVRTDPDVIIELDADGTQRPGGDAQAREIWSKLGNLAAVRNQRVYVLTGQEHFLLGPRIAWTYHALRSAIDGNDND